MSQVGVGHRIHSELRQFNGGHTGGQHLITWKEDQCCNKYLEECVTRVHLNVACSLSTHNAGLNHIPIRAT